MGAGGSSQLCGYHGGNDAGAEILPVEDEACGEKLGHREPGALSSGRSTATSRSSEELFSAASGSADQLPIDPQGERNERVIEEAIRKASDLMEDTEILEAEAVLAAALKEMEDSPQACDQLRQSPIFTSVSDRVAQYDAICSMMANDKMRTLWESEDGKFELYQVEGTWFDYKMTLNIDAPLSECIATGQEVDLIPQAQANVSGTPEKLGPCSKFLMVTLMKLSVVLFRVELLFEVLRVRNKKFGFLAESIRSNFPADGRPIPEKGWRSVRPWVYTANVWMPRGGGQPGTVLVQVTRVDCGLNVPQRVLNLVFKQMAPTFMADLRKSAAKAREAGSPWAKRIKEDASGLYRDCRELEASAQQRRTVTAQTFPGSEVFDRPSRLMPEPVDTRPPSSR